jgi:hypothetical protein
MKPEQIVQRLKEGWSLANRGTGWWLSAPRVDYRTTKTCRVDDHVVDQLVADGVLKTELPYNTLWARLAEQGEKT